MANSASQQFSLFHHQIQNRRFGDMTVAILESVLASKDAKSSAEIRSDLKEFMRHEALAVIRETADISVDRKLVIVNFFVRAFALIGDVENCLALRYEAFVMRDEKASVDLRLRVSADEWLSFAEQSFDNRFYSVAVKACERALLDIHANNSNDSETDCFNYESTTEKIKMLKHKCMSFASSHSVQVQASEYLKKKNIIEKLAGKNSTQSKTHTSGSILFRNGIKKRNLRKLQERQSLQQFISNDA